MTANGFRAQAAELRREVSRLDEALTIERLRSARLSARVKELEEALEQIANLPGELNPSNYDHDDVCACNAALCETWAIARAALTKGESHD